MSTIFKQVYTYVIRTWAFPVFDFFKLSSKSPELKTSVFFGALIMSLYFSLSFCLFWYSSCVMIYSAFPNHLLRSHLFLIRHFLSLEDFLTL